MSSNFYEYAEQYKRYKKMMNPEYIKQQEQYNENYKRLCEIHRNEEKQIIWKKKIDVLFAEMFPDYEQKRKEGQAKMVDEKLNSHYDKINKVYKTMTRERTKDIVNKLDDMIHAYYNHLHLNAKQKRKNDNALISSRILNNKSCPEAATIPTIYTLYGAICLMYRFYKKDPDSLFDTMYLHDFYPCVVVISNENVKKGIGCDDTEIEEAYNFLMNLSNEEIEKRICNNIKDGIPIDTQSPSCERRIRKV